MELDMQSPVQRNDYTQITKTNLVCKWKKQITTIWMMKQCQNTTVSVHQLRPFCMERWTPEVWRQPTMIQSWLPKAVQKQNYQMNHQMPPWLLLQYSTWLFLLPWQFFRAGQWVRRPSRRREKEAWLSKWATDWGDQCGTFSEIQMWRFSFCGPNNRCLWWFQSLFHVYMCKQRLIRSFQLKNAATDTDLLAVSHEKDAQTVQIATSEKNTITEVCMSDLDVLTEVSYF